MSYADFVKKVHAKKSFQDFAAARGLSFGDKSKLISKLWNKDEGKPRVPLARITAATLASAKRSPSKKSPKSTRSPSTKKRTASPSRKSPGKKKKVERRCSPGKVWNPSTNRCVDRNGPVGRWVRGVGEDPYAKKSPAKRASAKPAKTKSPSAASSSYKTAPSATPSSPGKKRTWWGAPLDKAQRSGYWMQRDHMNKKVRDRVDPSMNKAAAAAGAAMPKDVKKHKLDAKYDCKDGDEYYAPFDTCVPKCGTGKKRNDFGECEDDFQDAEENPQPASSSSFFSRFNEPPAPSVPPPSAPPLSPDSPSFFTRFN